ncbi:MAG: cytochrome c oxidase assembly protein [Alphaproteobacteria bacterium]|nr:cytochrome c oxidase assembly protein [Alphaproteobacteria bacterium]
MDARDRRKQDQRGQIIVFCCLVAALGMLGASFAAVPLYRMFCQVTGFGGTTQVATAAPDIVLDRKVVVRFDSNVSRELPWRFVPAQRSVKVRLGERTLVAYRATNLSDRPLVGTATFNVTPDKVGSYFDKLQCFCFTEQRLEPGETVDMPVTFFVDPALADDPLLDEVKTITLSYTFYEAKKATAALDAGGASVRQGDAARTN